MKDYHRFDDVYSWHDRQCEECGFTNKCCACKWCRPFDLDEVFAIVKGAREAWGMCVNPVQNKGLSRGAHEVAWNDRCFSFEWVHEDGQISLDLNDD